MEWAITVKLNGFFENFGEPVFSNKLCHICIKYSQTMKIIVKYKEGYPAVEPFWIKRSVQVKNHN